MKTLHYIRILLMVVVGWAITISYAFADEVKIKHQGLTLNANLNLAEGADFSDGVVLVLHGMMAHHRMEIVEAIQTLLDENGLSSLAISLSLGIDDRHGFFDCADPHRHMQDDVFVELNAWVKWLREKGVTKITLIAHSRGANQAMVYAVEHAQPEIRHLVMLAPGVDDNIDAYFNRYGTRLETIISRMEQQVATGNGEVIIDNIDFWYCPKASISANSFLSYYSPMSKFRQFESYLNKNKIPTLVITGTLDEVHPKVEQKITPLANQKNIYLHVIENAGHFFRDLNMDEAMEATVEFLQETG